MGHLEKMWIKLYILGGPGSKEEDMVNYLNIVVLCVPPETFKVFAVNSEISSSKNNLMQHIAQWQVWQPFHGYGLNITLEKLMFEQ